MNLKDAVFINPNKVIDPSADIIFVADLFAEDYAGGAELTTEALIDESPYRIQKIRSRDVNLGVLEQGVSKLWVFGNFSQLNPELIPSIVANLKYTILEYDYKYCSLRSPEKHREATGKDCDCENQISGKIVSAFYYGAKCLWWMSENQKQRYLDKFPFLSEKDNIVLSSVFSKKTLGTIRYLNDASKSYDRKRWLVLGSESWVKGAKNSKKWCEDNNLDYEVVWNIPYEKLLEKLSRAEGFVYLPVGADTCPRMVIEAKLLGCKLHINEYVQHAKEEWFDTEDTDSISDYLLAAPTVFWNVIRFLLEKKPEISGYTTTYNCIKQGYPIEKCISSMLRFCKEVCIVDGGSTDGTWEKLSQWSTSESRIKIKQVPRDWGHKRHAVFDGMQKAEARKMCKSEFCWQMDVDEVVHENDCEKIVDLCNKIPKGVDLISLPVVEYWGGPEKVRLDIQPWKWRLSRNLPHITHGIPSELRRRDENGDLYAAPGTDGCDMIHESTGERIVHLTFHNKESELARISAIQGNEDSRLAYQGWFNQVIEHLPGVYHYSWYDIPRKIRLYRDYWTKHWNSLYDGSLEDTAETNMMFDLPWSQVTEEMIDAKAKDLKEKTGGWIWHQKWKGQSVPHITVDTKEPQ